MAKASRTAPTTDAKGSVVAAENIEEIHSIEARQQTREQLAADIEAFLNKGGTISEVEYNLRADPPKKPESSYGSGSI